MNQEIFQMKLDYGKIIKIIAGDITEEKVDAIVNAANSFLKHGGGVAGAIVKKGGRIIQEESDKIGFVPVGQAVLTTAGKLPAKYIIHAVGPRWGEGNESEKLKNAVKSCLELAEKRKFEQISIPAISAGIFGFPQEDCATIIISVIKEYFEKNQGGTLEEIRVCLFDNQMLQIFLKKCRDIFGFMIE
jgi:O-acetyl-ADP-ribose deacetylase (regulator of RNase III)